MTEPCPHLDVDLGALEALLTTNKVARGLRDETLSCACCHAGLPGLWVCLSRGCDFIGCGRTQNQHAMRHYSKQDHPVCLNLSTKQIWCYKCDDEVVALSDMAETHPTFFVLVQKTRRLLQAAQPRQDSAASGSAQRDGRRGLLGLRNLGNTCYLNAAVQAVLHCQPVAEHFVHLRNAITLDPPQTPRGVLAHAFTNLVDGQWGPQPGGVDAPLQKLVRSVFAINPSFSGFGQQDTQEFLRSFLDGLHEELRIEVPEYAQQPATPMPGELSSSSEEDDDDEEEEDDDDGHDHHDDDDDGEGGAGARARPTQSTSSPARKNNNKNTKKKKKKDKPPTPRRTQWASPISHIFEGQLLSEVECLACGKVSWTKDPFYDLSVSLPGKRQRRKLEKSHDRASSAVVGDEHAAPTGCISGRRAAAASKGGGGGWFSSLASWFSSSSSKPLTLETCLQNFVSTEELTGSEQYRCSRCKSLQDVTKTLSVHTLPEVLCVQLKRFRYQSIFSSKIGTTVQFPAEGLDMRPFMSSAESRGGSLPADTTYDLVAVINHHGGMGGGHYTSFARHFEDRQWYHFDDSSVHAVDQDTVTQSEGYVLFYQRSSSPAALELREDILSALEQAGQEDEHVLISRAWFYRFLSMSNPGPVSNYELLCAHQVASAAEVPGVSEKAIRIPRAIWDRMTAHYGGGPLAPRIEAACSGCAEARAALDARREEEKQLIQQRDTTEVKPGQHWYVISARWLTAWRNFVVRGDDVEPGPISNHVLLDRHGRPKRMLVKAKDYKFVNKAVWDTFEGIYGGGPAMVRAGLDIFQPPVHGFK